MSNRIELLKKSLIQYYKKSDNLEKIINVIEHKTKYSLRIIEWFCNNYSKKNNIVYKLDKNKEFNVYTSYKSQLDSYQKKQFDPFRRQHDNFEKIPLKYEDKVIYTTVAQLNFFRWCINNKILYYIDKNLKEIKDDMVKTLKYETNNTEKKKKKSIENKAEKVKNSRKKRQPLSATRVCVKRYTNAVLEFI